MRLFDDHGDEPGVGVHSVHRVRNRGIIVKGIARAEIDLVAAQNHLHMALEHIVKFLSLMGMRGLAFELSVVFNGNDEGLGLLILEIVGQMLIMIGLAAVERQTLAIAGEDIYCSG